MSQFWRGQSETENQGQIQRIFSSLVWEHACIVSTEFCWIWPPAYTRLPFTFVYRLSLLGKKVETVWQNCFQSTQIDTYIKKKSFSVYNYPTKIRNYAMDFWVLSPGMQVIAWLFTYKLYSTLVSLEVSEEKTHILLLLFLKL